MQAVLRARLWNSDILFTLVSAIWGIAVAAATIGVFFGGMLIKVGFAVLQEFGLRLITVQRTTIVEFRMKQHKENEGRWSVFPLYSDRELSTTPGKIEVFTTIRRPS